MITLRSEIELRQSSAPHLRYVYVDGVNCGTVDAVAINLRKHVSEARLAAIMAEVGDRQVISPPPEVPEEYYY